MTTSNNPDDIRRDIEETRSELSRDVDALTEKVSPARVVERRVERAKSAVGSVKDKVMGGSDSSSSSSYSSGGGLSGAGDKMSSLGDTASGAPQMARQKTQGNPLAAGMIAFGAGWLVSSLIPASEKEQQAAQAVKDKASEHSDTLKAPLTEAANEMKENLRGPAQQAAESVKSTATDAAANVKGEAQSAKDDVTSHAQQAKDEVSQQNDTTPADLRSDPLSTNRPL